MIYLNQTTNIAKLLDPNQLTKKQKRLFFLLQLQFCVIAGNVTLTTKAILKNAYFDTCIGTKNKSKDTRKISEGPLFIDAKTTHIKSHISRKSGKNIDNQYKESRLKSPELNSRESQTESETCSDNFGDFGQSKDDPEALTNEYNYKFGIENSDSFTNSEDEFEKTEPTMDIEQDVREIDRINNQRNLLNRNALKKPKLRPSPIDPKDITTMWEKIEDAQSGKNLTYWNIFYYQNGQKVYLKDLSPSEVVEILYEASGSDTEKKKKISELKEQFISLIQNDHGKLKNLKREKENFESKVFNLLKPYGFEPTQKIVVQTAILAEAVAVLLHDTFTDFAKLSDDDIADAIIAAFLYKSKSDWLDGANLCFNSENYVKKILASVFPNLDEQRCMRIANAIDHKKDPLFDSDGSMKKDLLAIILQITDHLDHQDDIKFFDFTSKDYKIDTPSFNFSSPLSSEEVQARIITFLERTKQFIDINTNNLAEEVLSDLKKNPKYDCPLGRSLYKIYRNGSAHDTHLFEVNRPYFKYNSQPCNDASCGSKMENVTPKQISKFLSLDKDEFKAKVQSSKRMFMLLRKKDRKPEENKELEDINKNLPKFVGKKCSELFRYENVFEIAENFLKLPKVTVSAFLIQRRFSSVDIDHTLSIVASCLELKKNGWSEKFAQRVTFYRVRLLEDKVFMKGHRGGRGVCKCKDDDDSSPEKKIQKSLLQYSKVKIGNQVTISHTRNCTYKFAKFVSFHGGIYPLIELLMKFHNTSSWCTIPVIVKAWLLHQREDPNTPWGTYLNEKPATTDPDSVFFNFTDGTLLGDKEGVEKYLKIISNQEESFYDKLVIQTLAFWRCQDFLYYEQDVIYQADVSIKEILNSGSVENSVTQLKSIRDHLGKIMSNIEKQIKRCSNSTSKLLRMVPDYFEPVVTSALAEVISDIEQAINLTQKELKNALPEISRKLLSVKENFDNSIQYMFDLVLVGRRDDIQFTDLLKTKANENTVLNEKNVHMFNETLYMFYAFVQSMLYLTPDFPKEFYRSFDDKAFENYFGCASEKNAKSTTKKLKNTATYDAYHIIKLSQFGDNAVKISPDPWRIFMPYPLLCSLIPSWQVDYNEFDIMAGDCDATILEDDPDEDSDKGFSMHSFLRSRSDQSHGGYSDCDNYSAYSEGSDSEV